MKVNYLISILLIAVMVSCSTSTKITGSWVEQGQTAPKEYKKIAVIALANKTSSQLTFERTFVDRLKYLGYDAIETSSFLVPSVVTKENAEMLDKLMKDRGVDGVIILSLLQVKDGVRYVPGSTPYTPGPYYGGGYYGYYNYNYNQMNSGYYEETTSIFLESNFYDLNSVKLLSSIQTETADPSGVDDLALSYSSTILKKLIADKVLANNSLSK